MLDDTTLVLDPSVDPASIDPALDESLPLCPALVGIGTDTVGDVLVDLERIGPLVVEADSPANAEDVLAAIALEHLGLPWAIDNTVHVIGLDRLHGVAHVEHVEDVGAFIAAVRAEVDARDADSAASGTHLERLRGTEIWPVRLVLVGPGRSDAARELAGFATRPASALAVVTASPLPDTHCRLVVTDSVVELKPAGLTLTKPDIRCVTVPPEAEHLVADVVDDTDALSAANETEPLSATDAGEDGGRSIDELIAEILQPEDVELVLLDEIPRLEGVTWNGKQAARADEVVAFLAVHGPATPRQLGEAFWPGRRNTAQQVSQAVSRTRAVLGNSDGHPRLTVARRNAPYELVGVGCDWKRFERLVHLADRRPADAAAVLEAALSLVRGAPFAARRERSFEWAADLGYESTMRLAACAVAARLAECYIGAGRVEDALRIVDLGLRAAPESDRLVELRCKALVKSGQSGAAIAEAQRLADRAEALDGLLAKIGGAHGVLVQQLLHREAR